MDAPDAQDGVDGVDGVDALPSELKTEGNWKQIKSKKERKGGPIDRC